MKKRYLAMLMAVVMCIGLFVTGAMAADEGEEVPAETAETTAEVTAEVTAESAAPASEAPAPSEQAAISEPPADVPQPVVLGSDGEGEGNQNSLTQIGVAIAGYSSTVLFNVPEVVAEATPSPNWSTPSPNGVTCGYVSDESSDAYTLKLSVSDLCKAGDYPFTLSVGSITCSGVLKVLTLQQAKSQNLITYEGFELYKYTTVDEEDIAISAAKFEVYKHTPDPSAPSPVATFTTDADGKTTITPAEIGNVLDYPDEWQNDYYLVDASRAGSVGRCQYKAVTKTENGYYNPVELISTIAQMVEADNGATTGLKIGFAVRENNDPDSPFQCYTENETKKLKVYTEPEKVWKYEGFELGAWTAKTLTWNSSKNDYDFTGEYLAGVKFGVFSDEDCTNLIQEFTTGENGKVAVMLDDDKLPITNGDSKVYYLKQTGTTTTVNGERPMADCVWKFTATATENAAGDVVTVKLGLPEEDPSAVGQRDGDGEDVFWVYNQRYTSISFDIEQQVAVKNEGMETGENTFELLVAVGTGPETKENNRITFFYTPEGGEKTKVTKRTRVTYYADSSHEQVKYVFRLYTVPVTVDGEGSAKVTITLEGWEYDLYVWWLEVYQKNDAPDDWEYAPCMYSLVLPSRVDDNGEEFMLLYDDVPLGIARYDASEDGWEGEDDRLYSDDYTQVQSVTFVNTYTKAPAVVTPEATATPAPTAKPAQSPKTGDEAMPMLWLSLAGVSVLGVALVTRKKVK